MSSKIPLDDWVEMERLAREAAVALKKLEQYAFDKWLAWHDAGEEREATVMRKVYNRMEEAYSDLWPQGFWVQSEWTGGDSCDPKNSTLREPNVAGNMTHSFPKEQVDKYRDKDGEIRIPHRCKGVCTECGARIATPHAAGCGKVAFACPDVVVDDTITDPDAEEPSNVTNKMNDWIRAHLRESGGKPIRMPEELRELFTPESLAAAEVPPVYGPSPLIPLMGMFNALRTLEERSLLQSLPPDVQRQMAENDRRAREQTAFNDASFAALDGNDQLPEGDADGTG